MKDENNKQPYELDDEELLMVDGGVGNGLADVKSAFRQVSAIRNNAAASSNE